MTAPPDGSFLPYGYHLVEEDDVAAVAEVLRQGRLTDGPQTGAFEAELAEAVGARHAVACSSGTAALHLACAALDLGPERVALVPAMTFLATANAPRLLGGEVAFTDVDPGTGLVRGEDLDRIAPRGVSAGALLPVHLNGQAAPMESLGRTAGARGWAVIEDGCHALGSRFRTADGDWARVGDCRFSDATVFSFHPVKTVAMGEGGAVTTNDPELARRIHRLRNHGIVREPEGFGEPERARDSRGEIRPWYLEMAEPGFNYRPSELHCALGRSQLAKLPRFAEKRRALRERYDAALTRLAPTVRPVERVPESEPVLHLYPVFVDWEAAGKERSQVMRELRERGIGTQVHYRPVSHQPYYRQRYGDQELPGAEAYYRGVLSLPYYAGMAETEVDRVVEGLEDVLCPAG